MSLIKGIVTAGLLTVSLNEAGAAQLSDFQGRSHIPDTDLNNCARQALIDHAFGSNGMTQDVYQENGKTTYHFETYGPNREETLLDVIQVGHSKEIQVYVSGGSSTERKNAILGKMSLCM